MTLGVVLGLLLSLFIILTEPKKKAERVEKLVDEIESLESKEEIDLLISQEISKLAKDNRIIGQDGNKVRKANILMARFM